MAGVNLEERVVSGNADGNDLLLEGVFSVQ